MSEQTRDNYCRKAKQQDSLERSAFKLLQIDEKFNIFEGVTRAVDLCAGPGSWSQVLSRRLYLCEKIEMREKSCLFYNEMDLHRKIKVQELDEMYKNDSVKIVAVDMQPLPPLPGVIQLQGDITKYSTAQEILSNFEGEKAELVVCDGAPDVTGLHCVEIYMQTELLLSALDIASNILKSGGTFVIKIFRGKDNDLLKKQLDKLFKEVHVVNPNNSRDSGIEAFFVCQDYLPQEVFDETLIHLTVPYNSDTAHPLQICGEEKVLLYSNYKKMSNENLINV